MGRNLARWYDALMDYHLEMFSPPRSPSTLRMGIGKLHFSAGNDAAAVDQMRALFPERLREADYARLVDDAGKLVWESKGWDA